MMLTIEQFDNHVQVTGDGAVATFDRGEWDTVTPKEILTRIRDEVAEHAVAYTASDPVVFAGNDPVVFAATE